MASCLLRDGKNAAFDKSLPSIIVGGESGKRHALRAHMPEAVSDWLNPLSSGTMSASGYIENLAENSTCLINSQELIRSI